MNREIKFRYRIEFPSPQGKIHIYYFALEEIEKGIIQKDFLTAGVKIVSRDLFTGSKDKNDKEIYDGDILRYKNVHLKKYVKIIWSKRYARFVQSLFIRFKSPKRENVRVLIRNMKKVNQMEIVGNTYENPELMK